MFRDELLLSGVNLYPNLATRDFYWEITNPLPPKKAVFFFRRSDPIRRCFLATKMHDRVPGIAPFVFVYCVLLNL